MLRLVVLLMLAGTCLAGSERPGQQVVQCDLMELNHVYGDRGELKYVQVLIMDWSPDYRRYDIQAWVLLDRLQSGPSRRLGGWQIVGLDGVVVRSRMFRETYTRCDPERNQQKYFPAEYRGRIWDCLR